MATPTKKENQSKSEKQDQLNSLSIGTPKAGTTKSVFLLKQLNKKVI